MSSLKGLATIKAYPALTCRAIDIPPLRGWICAAVGVPSPTNRRSLECFACISPFDASCQAQLVQLHRSGI